MPRLIIRYGLILISLVAILAGVYTQYKSSQTTPYNLAMLELPDLNKEVRSGEQWRGKIVVLNHWATWCPPCREEMPILMQFQEDMADKNIQVIGVAHDLLESARIFADSIGLNYPSLIAIVDGQEILQQQGNESGALPFTVIFDPQGQIRQTFLGQLTYEKLSELVAPLLDNETDSKKS